MKYDIDYFDKIWSSGKTDPIASKELWDSRAGEFKKHKSKERVHQIVNFLASKQALDNTSEVLDIGCGTGKYTLEFAKRANNVIGIDISPKMIEFARENALEQNLTNTEFMAMSWDDINLEDLGWKKKFKLVSAIMTPAINSRKCLENMLEASNGYCIMSGHVIKKERIMEEIERDILHRQKPGIDYGRNIYCSFNILWQKGIYPELSYDEMERENERTIEDAFNYYCLQLQRRYEINENKKVDIKEYLNKIAEKGIVKDVFYTKNAWLFWKNN